MKMTLEAKRAVEALENSNTYAEFKMKLALNGVELYNIAVLRSLWHRFTPAMSREFKADIRKNAWNDGVEAYCMRKVSEHLAGVPHKGFDVFIANEWMRHGFPRGNKARNGK